MEAEDDPQKDCEPDDGFSIVFQTESCEFVELFRRLQFVFLAVPMLLGVSTKKTSYLATPHMVFTDNCKDRRYLSELRTYHTASNAITTRSGSVGELSGSSSSMGRSDQLTTANGPRGLDRLELLGSARIMWLEGEEHVECRWDRR